METYTNKFGVEIRVGMKAKLFRRFTTNLNGDDCTVESITPSGKFFKVTGSESLFSTLTFNCKGSHLGNTYIILQ